MLIKIIKIMYNKASMKPYVQFRQRYDIMNDIFSIRGKKYFRVYDKINQRSKIQQKLTTNIQFNDASLNKELQIMKSIQHPNIITYEDFSIQNNYQKKNNPYLHLIYQETEGKSVEYYANKLNKDEILDIFQQIRSIFNYLSKNNILFKSLPFQYISIDKQLNIKLIYPLYQNLFNKYSNLKYDLASIFIYLIFGSSIMGLTIQKPGDMLNLPDYLFDLYGLSIPDKIAQFFKSQEKIDNKFCYSEKQKIMNIENLFITQATRRLILNNKKISKQSIINITQKLKQLYFLDLSGNQIDQQFAQGISKMHNLKFLLLKNCNIDIKTLTKLTQNQLNLVKLDLSQNPKISQKQLQVIFRSFKNIKSFIYNSNSITFSGVKQICKKKKELRILHLCNDKLQDDSLTILSQNMKFLTELNLSCNKISSKSLRELKKENMQQLRILNLSKNNIDNQGAILIGEKFPKLTQLNLSNNNISNQGALILSKQFSNINKLNLQQNSITNDVIQLIQNTLRIKQLKI